MFWKKHSWKYAFWLYDASLTSTFNFCDTFLQISLMSLLNFNLQSKFMLNSFSLRALFVCKSSIFSVLGSWLFKKCWQLSVFRVLVFHGPRPFAWPPVLVPNLYLPALGPQFVFTGPGPKFVFTALGPKFVFTDPGSKFLFTRLGQSEAWACRYQPRPPNLYLLALAYDFYYHALNLHLPSYP